MLKDSRLGHKFWVEAVYIAMYLQNRSPTKALDGMIHEEVYYGMKPSVSHLCVFGCLVYAHVHKQNRQKLDDKSIKCIFIGYATCSKAYKLYDPLSQKVIITRDVLFDETKTSADFHLQEKEEDPLIFFEVDEETGDMKDEGFKAAQNRPASIHDGIPPQDMHEIVPNIPNEVPIDGGDTDNTQGVKKLPKWYIKTIEDSSILEQADSNNDGLRRSQRKGQRYVTCELCFDGKSFF